MSTHTNTPFTRMLPVGVLALGLIAALSWQAGAVSAQGSSAAHLAQPTSVAVVDLNAVFDQLDEMNDRKEAHAAKGAELQRDLNAKLERIENLKLDLEALVQGSPEYEAKALEGIKLENDLKMDQQVFQQRLNLSQGESDREMYLKIQAAIEVIAARNEIDLVLFDDTSVELPPKGTRNDMMGIIVRKQVLFSSDKIDITDELILAMNAEYGAG